MSMPRSVQRYLLLGCNAYHRLQIVETVDADDGSRQRIVIFGLVRAVLRTGRLVCTHGIVAQ